VSADDSTRLQIAFFKPFDSFYINRTARIYHELLEAIPGVSTIGIYNHSAYNPVGDPIVVFTPFVFMGASRQHFHDAQTRFDRAYDVPFRSRISFELCQTYFRKFLKFYERSRASLVLLSEYDVHALTPEDLALSCSGRTRDFLLIPGAELFDRTASVGRGVKESDLSDERLDIGYKVLEDRRGRVVSLPHVIAADEFSSASEVIWRTRTRRLVVPGASYSERRAAVSNVVRKLPREYAGHLVDKAMGLAFKGIHQPRLRNFAMWSYFRHTIEKSWLSFTCGSTGGYLVRKFFEIPAFGSCLCTFEYTFLPRCGLVSNVHYLPLSDVRDLADYCERLKDVSFARHVIDCASAARAIVLELHSAFARYRQLSDTLGRIATNSFFGSYWEQGEYKFRRHP